MIATSTWVVCAPGDPTDAQWRAMRELAGDDDYTATHFNERSEWVRVSIWRDGGSEDHYSVAPNGREATYIDTTEAQR